MKHTTIHALGPRANVIAQEALALRLLRRARLERFAGLLDAREGTVRLFSSIEYLRFRNATHRAWLRLRSAS